MRTTLELDDELIETSRSLAQERGVTLGQLISELARQSLSLQVPLKVRNGVPLFVSNGNASKPDLKTVNALRDDK